MFSGRFEPAVFVILDPGWNSLECCAPTNVRKWAGMERGREAPRSAVQLKLTFVFEGLDCLGLMETQLLCLGEAQLLVTRASYNCQELVNTKSAGCAASSLGPDSGH